MAQTFDYRDDHIGGNVHSLSLHTQGKVVCSVDLVVTRDDLFLSDLATRNPLNRRKGYAEKLLTYIIYYSGLRDRHTVTLNVDPDNKPAVALYEKLGFVFMTRKLDIHGHLIMQKQ
jgi:ribosomal protein S18 acetylase RimI-like enzyme